MTTTETANVPGQGRSSFGGRLKTNFFPKWDDHVHTQTVVAGLIAKKGGTMGGKESLGSVRDSLPQSQGIALFEYDNMPEPASPTYFQPYLHARDIYGVLQWSGQVRRAARGGDKFAWAKPRAEDVAGADKQFRINFARMLYLGPYQPLATVSSYDGGTDIATLYGRDARLSGAANFWKFGAHYLRKKMAIQHTDGLTNSVASATTGYISAIDKSDPTAPTVTIVDDVDVDNGSVVDWALADPDDASFLIPAGSRRSSPGTTIDKYAGVNGLLQMVTDTSPYSYLYDLDRSDYDTLNGIRHKDDAGAERPFSEDLLQLGMDNISDDGLGDDIDTLLMNKAVRREYVKESKGDRRFKEVQTEKGFGKLVYNGGDTLVPVVVDRDCPPGLVFLLNTADFAYLEESPMDSIDESGDRFVASKDAHQMIVHKSGNVRTKTPLNNGTIEDIAFRMKSTIVE